MRSAIKRTFRVTWVSRRPRICVFDGFLDASECAALRELTASRMQPTLVDEGHVDPMRTSNGCWVPRGDMHRAWNGSGSSQRNRLLMRSIEERIADASGVPIEHGEPCQVLRYTTGQEYKLHPDFISGADGPALRNGGQRIMTFLCYLNTVPESSGGATLFPRRIPTDLEGRGSQRRRGRRADSSRPGPTEPVRIQPVEGRAVLWHNTLPDGNIDVLSLHAGEPLQPQAGLSLSGANPEKWLLSKWLRARPFVADEEAAAVEGF